MIALMPNGREILLPDPVEVGIEASYDLSMTVPASLFEDTLESMTGDLIPNQEIQFIDVELGEDEMITLISDEEGNVSMDQLLRVITTSVWIWTTMDSTNSTKPCRSLTSQ